MSGKFTFVHPKSAYEYNPQNSINTYYQICQFKNPKGLYETRKILFDENFNIVQTFERSYKKDLLDKFIQNTKPNKFKMFAVPKIEYVALPTSHELMESQSQLLL